MTHLYISAVLSIFINIFTQKLFLTKPIFKSDKQNPIYSKM